MNVILISSDSEEELPVRGSGVNQNELMIPLIKVKAFLKQQGSELISLESLQRIAEQGSTQQPPCAYSDSDMDKPLSELKSRKRPNEDSDSDMDKPLFEIRSKKTKTTTTTTSTTTSTISASRVNVVPAAKKRLGIRQFIRKENISPIPQELKHMERQRVFAHKVTKSDYDIWWSQMSEYLRILKDYYAKWCKSNAVECLPRVMDVKLVPLKGSSKAGHFKYGQTFNEIGMSLNTMAPANSTYQEFMMQSVLTHEFAHATHYYHNRIVQKESGAKPDKSHGINFKKWGDMLAGAFPNLIQDCEAYYFHISNTSHLCCPSCRSYFESCNVPALSVIERFKPRVCKTCQNTVYMDLMICKDPYATGNIVRVLSSYRK